MTDETDRASIQFGITQLIEGHVNGPLTVVRLAEVAGLKRWKLTHKHVDLMRFFQEQIGALPTQQKFESDLEDKLKAEVERNRLLSEENRRLNSVLERYAAVISELSFGLANKHSAMAPGLSNVLPFVSAPGRQPQI